MLSSETRSCFMKISLNYIVVQEISYDDENKLYPAILYFSTHLKKKYLKHSALCMTELLDELYAKISNFSLQV